MWGATALLLVALVSSTQGTCRPKPGTSARHSSRHAFAASAHRLAPLLISSFRRFASALTLPPPDSHRPPHRRIAPHHHTGVRRPRRRGKVKESTRIRTTGTSRASPPRVGGITRCKGFALHTHQPSAQEEMEPGTEGMAEAASAQDETQHASVLRPPVERFPGRETAPAPRAFTFDLLCTRVIATRATGKTTTGNSGPPETQELGHLSRHYLPQALFDGWLPCCPPRFASRRKPPTPVPVVVVASDSLYAPSSPVPFLPSPPSPPPTRTLHTRSARPIPLLRPPGGPPEGLYRKEIGKVEGNRGLYTPDRKGPAPWSGQVALRPEI